MPYEPEAEHVVDHVEHAPSEIGNVGLLVQPHDQGRKVVGCCGLPQPDVPSLRPVSDDRSLSQVANLGWERCVRPLQHVSQHIHVGVWTDRPHVGTQQRTALRQFVRLKCVPASGRCATHRLALVRKEGLQAVLALAADRRIGDVIGVDSGSSDSGVVTEAECKIGVLAGLLNRQARKRYLPRADVHCRWLCGFQHLHERRSNCCVVAVHREVDEPLNEVTSEDRLRSVDQPSEAGEGVLAMGVQDGEEALHGHRPHSEHWINDEFLDRWFEGWPALPVRKEQRGHRSRGPSAGRVDGLTDRIPHSIAVLTIQPIVLPRVRGRLRDVAEHPDNILRDILIRQRSNRVRGCVLDSRYTDVGDAPQDAAYLLACPRPLRSPRPRQSAQNRGEVGGVLRTIHLFRKTCEAAWIPADEFLKPAR